MKRHEGTGRWMAAACLLCAVTIVTAAVTAGVAQDEVAEALETERIVLEELRKGIEPMPKASELSGTKTGTTRSRGDVGGSASDRLLRAKDRELAEAHKEIERLQDLVKKVLAANRRERASMHYNMGCVLRVAGHPLKAETAFLRALEINADDAGVHYNLGILYDEDLDDRIRARRHYELFLELAPNDKDAMQVREWLIAL